MEIPKTLDQLNEQLDGWSDMLKDPLWYQQAMPILLDWWENFPKDETRELLKDRIYQYFADKLEKGEIVLGRKGPNFDQERKPVDTIIIHHSSRKPGVSWQELSAIGFLRQYVHDYYLYDDVFDQDTKDQPIWSGHFRDGIQVFYAYHWLVRMNGESVRLLEDHYLGWHAGNRDVNRRSIAIVLDGDFQNSEPSHLSLEGVARLMREQYPHIKTAKILGHLEVSKTECPGRLFLPVWKNKLLSKFFEPQ
ncbi:N-acetylmuramoyl-L-alanine amidase [Candidatus Daviesbacteria bacterium]|nr:N-acetylmuramoyl-L-alanine amidase [Candidatus Daviesbacteria bacterium]